MMNLPITTPTVEQDPNSTMPPSEGSGFVRFNGHTYIIHNFDAHKTEDQLEQMFEHKKSGFEKRNPNQPFYAGIRKRRR